MNGTSNGASQIRFIKVSFARDQKEMNDYILYVIFLNINEVYIIKE